MKLRANTYRFTKNEQQIFMEVFRNFWSEFFQEGFSQNTLDWFMLLHFICCFSSITLQFQIIGEGGGSPTDNLNINKRGGGVQIKTGWVWKLFSVRSGSPLPLIMGITLAESRSARGASHQPSSMGDCLSISHACLPSHVFASFAFLMLSVFAFQEKWESLHSRLRQG